MRRALGLGVLVILTAVGLLWPVLAQLSAGSSGAGSAPDPVTITRYEADLAVDADGLLRARETITGDFPMYRHGIFRFWDVRDPGDPTNRYTPTITSITMDGGPVMYDVYREGGDRYVVAKIGDPDVYLDRGEHTYVITYTVPGALSPGRAGSGRYESSEGDVSAAAPSAFYWNVVAPGWRNQILAADITITLPAPATGVQCTAGADVAGQAGRGPCSIAGAGTQTVRLTAEDIPPQTGMTARITLPIAAPSRDSVPWPVTFDKVLGTSWPPVLIVLLLMGAGIVAGISLTRSVTESEPGLPVTYAPPAGLGPVQTIYIADEEVGDHPLVSTILYLADRGAVTLEHREDDTWLVTGTGSPEVWAALDPVSRDTLVALGVAHPGYWFLADGGKETGKKLLEVQEAIELAAEDWATGSGLAVRDRGACSGCLIWAGAFVAAVVGFTGLAWPTMWGLPFAAFAICATAIMGISASTRRTALGRRVWSEAGGFRRMLSTPSSEQRFDFAANRDLFIPYIPYAVAFGVAAAWAEKYRVETHEDPPVPSWYPLTTGAAYASLYSGEAGFDSFDSSLSSAIGAYEASQSSSGGGGGGGSFGGGGGGGGGGSW